MQYPKPGKRRSKSSISSLKKEQITSWPVALLDVEERMKAFGIKLNFEGLSVATIFHSLRYGCQFVKRVYMSTRT